MQNSPNKEDIRFSLLDFGFRDSSMNSMKIIEDVIEYARLADRLGYKRLWLTEHHISDSMAAWYNPLPILPLLAGMTQNIKIGIAGTQLSLHNPYHVAINYKLLANLFENRIDLGLATGNPPDNIINILGKQHNDVQTKIDMLIRLLQDEDNLMKNEELIIPPFKGSLPNLWLLSSNYNRLDEVLKYGISFSRSLFHRRNDSGFEKERLLAFKEAFFVKHNRYPDLTLTFSGCCHTTDLKARQVADKAKYFGITNINITGSPERFKDLILEYQENFGFNEFTFLNLARLPKDRKIGIKLIQKAFNF